MPGNSKPWVANHNPFIKGVPAILARPRHQNAICGTVTVAIRICRCNRSIPIDWRLDNTNDGQCARRTHNNAGIMRLTRQSKWLARARFKLPRSCPGFRRGSLWLLD
jgi:hypothetical protein